MSWIDDFSKLPITLKSIVASVCICMPFWFISIYLFNKSLFNTNDYPLLLSFCFCFSLTWYFINIIFAAAAIGFMEKIKDEEEVDGDVIFIVSGIISIIYLCAAIVLSYWHEISFNYFLLFAYSYIVFRIILLTIIHFIFRNSYSSKNKNI
jgi:hypothetical protein